MEGGAERADNDQSAEDAMSTVMLEDDQGLHTLMQDFRARFVSPSSEEPSLQEIRDSYREMLRNVTDSCTAKQREGERMIERVQELRAEIEDQNRRIEEKQDAILQEIAKMKENKQLSTELSSHIHQLREEITHKRELALANRKANKEKLKELQQSAMLFKERLGLEIRKLQGDRLQFVFRCINPKELEEPYSCIIYFNEDGEYQRKLPGAVMGNLENTVRIGAKCPSQLVNPLLPAATPVREQLRSSAGLHRRVREESTRNQELLLAAHQPAEILCCLVHTSEMIAPHLLYVLL
ncbi:kinetochore protein Spc25 isoform X2 [Dendrobates tinctorius]|uniref:kinetochore protein Spc25 isoform X2 n=1 Tax=Dendrobates tinctorius TaxID=92724 RepID=UPI003CC9C285